MYFGAFTRSISEFVFYKVIIVNVLLRGCESWAIQSKEAGSSSTDFQFRCFRSILKINVMHKILRETNLHAGWLAMNDNASCKMWRVRKEQIDMKIRKVVHVHVVVVDANRRVPLRCIFYMCICRNG